MTTTTQNSEMYDNFYNEDFTDDEDKNNKNLVLIRERKEPYDFDKANENHKRYLKELNEQIKRTEIENKPIDLDTIEDLWNKYSTAEKIYCRTMTDGVLVLVDYDEFNPELELDKGFRFLIKCDPEDRNENMYKCLEKIPKTCKQFIYYHDNINETDKTKLIFPDTIEEIFIGLHKSEDDAREFYENDNNYIYIVLCECCGQLTVSDEDCRNCNYQDIESDCYM